MTSMRVDGGKSAKVWARRLKNLVETAEADGVAFMALEADSVWVKDMVSVYKDGDTRSVEFKIWSDE